MRRIKQLATSIIALFAGLAATPALAHEKWYADEGVLYSAKPIIFAEITAFGVIVAGLAFVIFVVLYLLDRKYEKLKWLRKFDRLAKMHLEAKTVLVALLGASLMGAGLLQTYLVLNLQLPDTSWGFILLTVSILLGILFMFFVHFSAELGIVLALFWLAGFTLFPVSAMLEELLFLAIAVYLITQEAGHKPWKKFNTAEIRRKGYHAFRILLGLAFIVLSFVKWLRPDLGITLVDEYGINFIAGLGFDSAHFLFFAAVTELFIGLAILFRVFLRPVAIVGIFIFSASIFVFGFPELLGHLPIKASLFMLFVYGPYLKEVK